MRENQKLQFSCSDRLDEERLKEFTEEQAQKLEENAVYIDKLQNRERFFTQNVMFDHVWLCFHSVFSIL